MTETNEPKLSLIEEFKALNAKQWAAICGAFLVSAVLTAFNLAISCMGFLIIAVILYMVPHILGVASPKVKAVIGAVFIVVMLLVGTFGFAGSPSDTEVNAYSSLENIKEITYEYEDGKVVIRIEATESGLDLKAETRTVSMMSFGVPVDTGGEKKEIKFTDLGGGRYEASPGIFDNEYNVIFVEISQEKTGENYKQIYRLFLNTGVSGGEMTAKSMMGAGYEMLLVGLMYFILLIFSEVMRRSARKTRGRMEAEGRLYPEGYGSCKECGAMVLPGEITCRKCGAPIDVPEDVKILHKKDFFECSECGAEIPKDAVVCPKCGARFDEKDEAEIVHADGTVDTSSETFECSECGKEVPANAKRCPYCGADFDEED